VTVTVNNPTVSHRHKDSDAM